MADLRPKTSSCFRQLCISDTEFVSNVWQMGFLVSDGELESAFLSLDEENINLGLLKEACSLVNKWASGEQEESDTGFFSALSDDGVSIRSVLALLFVAITGYSKKGTSVEEKATLIICAKLYMDIISLPGSSPYQLFEAVLYQNCLLCLKMIPLVVDGGVRRKKKGKQPVRSQKAKRARGSQPSQDINLSSGSSFDAFADEEEEEEPADLTHSEKTQLRKLLVGVVHSLLGLVNMPHVTSSASCTQQTIEALCLLTSSDLTLELLPELTEPTPTRASFCVLGYKGLWLLCCNSDGSTSARRAGKCFRCLLPNLTGILAKDLTPREVNSIRTQACSFVKQIAMSGGQQVGREVKTLLQNLCTKVTVTDHKIIIAKFVSDFVLDSRQDVLAPFIDWVFCLCRSDKVSQRMFALEILEHVMKAGEPEGDSGDLPECLRPHNQFALVVGRCSDVSPTVCSRALQIVASSISLMNTERVQSLWSIGAPGGASVTTTGQGNSASTTGVDVTGADTGLVDPSSAAVTNRSSSDYTTTASTDTTVGRRGGFCTVNVVPGELISMRDGMGLLAIILRRAENSRVVVRRAALLALENYLMIKRDSDSAQELDAVSRRCRDVSLSIRKQAMILLTNVLLEFPRWSLLQKVWLESVLPMTLDRESTVQDKCMELINELIFSNISKYRPNPVNGDDGSALTWSLLNMLSECQASSDTRRFLQRACHYLTRAGLLSSRLSSVLPSHVGTENNRALWMLLAEISSGLTRLDTQFVVNYWLGAVQNCPDSTTVNNVLVVIANCYRLIPAGMRRELKGNLLSDLQLFSLPPERIQLVVRCVSKLSSEDDVNWARDLVTTSHSYLSRAILKSSSGPLDYSPVICHLMTLGEAALFCPSEVPTKIFFLIQSLIAKPIDDEGEARLSQDRASQRIMEKFGKGSLPTRVRAFAFITLGKLCLQHEKEAKRCIPTLVQELNECPDPVIRNNVMVILSDLCKRYTNAVDAFVPKIAVCLRDCSVILRKQTLICLSHLLQEDFIKWKGPLFSRFIITILDTDESIKSLATYALIYILAQRQPNMFFNHFIGTIFTFNDYVGFKTYNMFPQTDRERQAFSLRGSSFRDDRHTVYTFMLANMPDGQRFQLTAKLCKEILVPVMEGALPLDSKSSPVVKDALWALCSKEIKPSSLRARPAEDAVDEQDMAAIVVTTAKKTIITHAMRKNVVENIIPVVVELKRKLELRRSPLLRDLMLYLIEIMKDYKTETKEILAGDPRLAAEVEYDLRKFEEEKERLAALEKQREADLDRSRRSLVATGTESRSSLVSARLGALDGTLNTTRGSVRATPDRATPNNGSGRSTPIPVSERGTPSINPARNTPRRNLARNTSERGSTGEDVKEGIAADSDAGMDTDTDAVSAGHDNDTTEASAERHSIRAEKGNVSGVGEGARERRGEADDIEAGDGDMGPGEDIVESIINESRGSVLRVKVSDVTVNRALASTSEAKRNAIRASKSVTFTDEMSAASYITKDGTGTPARGRERRVINPPRSASDLSHSTQSSSHTAAGPSSSHSTQSSSHTAAGSSSQMSSAPSSSHSMRTSRHKKRGHAETENLDVERGSKHASARSVGGPERGNIPTRRSTRSSGGEESDVSLDPLCTFGDRDGKGALSSVTKQKRVSRRRIDSDEDDNHSGDEDPNNFIDPLCAPRPSQKGGARQPPHASIHKSQVSSHPGSSKDMLSSVFSPAVDEHYAELDIEMELGGRRLSASPELVAEGSSDEVDAVSPAERVSARKVGRSLFGKGRERKEQCPPSSSAQVPSERSVSTRGKRKLRNVIESVDEEEAEQSVPVSSENARSSRGNRQGPSKTSPEEPVDVSPTRRSPRLGSLHQPKSQPLRGSPSSAQSLRGSSRSARSNRRSKADTVNSSSPEEPPRRKRSRPDADPVPSQRAHLPSSDSTSSRRNRSKQLGNGDNHLAVTQKKGETRNAKSTRSHHDMSDNIDPLCTFGRADTGAPGTGAQNPAQFSQKVLKRSKDRSADRQPSKKVRIDSDVGEDSIEIDPLCLPPPRPSNKSKALPLSRIAILNSAKKARESTLRNGPGFRTPSHHHVQSRAVSTPGATLTHITFQADQLLSPISQAPSTSNQGRTRSRLSK